MVCFMAITLYLPGGLRKTTVKITCTIPNEILRVHWFSALSSPTYSYKFNCNSECRRLSSSTIIKFKQLSHMFIQLFFNTKIVLKKNISDTNKNFIDWQCSCIFIIQICNRWVLSAASLAIFNHNIAMFKMLSLPEYVCLFIRSDL